MDIGEKIHNLRLENHMTLEELGDKVGVGKSTVRKWEQGIIQNMRRDKIDLLAKALNCSPAYLMGWSEEIEIPIEITTAFDKGQQLARIYQYEELYSRVVKLLDMNDELRQFAFNQIDFLYTQSVNQEPKPTDN